MRSTLLAISVLLACGGPARGAEAVNPHHMVDAAGALDDTVCGLCHEDDFTLTRSQTETCTLCHSAAPHAGAAAHLAASAAAVERLVASDETGIEIPLTDEGGIYCGSCHLYHDPAVQGEQWLDHGWVPSATSGLGKAVRDGLTEWFADQEARREADAAPVSIEWMKTGTRMLRLSVEDGSLCKRCHGGLLR